MKERPTVSSLEKVKKPTSDKQAIRLSQVNTLFFPVSAPGKMSWFPVNAIAICPLSIRVGTGIELLE